MKLKLTKTEQNRIRNAEIVRKFAETTKDHHKLAYYLATKHRITIGRVYQILTEHKNKAV